MIGDSFSYDTYVYKLIPKINIKIFYFRDSTPLSRYITGCVVSIRVRGHKIGLWLSDAQNAMAVREIGRRWKSMMNLSPAVRIQFEPHNENLGGQQKPMYEE